MHRSGRKRHLGCLGLNLAAQELAADALGLLADVELSTDEPRSTISRFPAGRAGNARLPTHHQARSPPTKLLRGRLHEDFPRFRGHPICPVDLE
jgi:hypothetical protein